MEKNWCSNTFLSEIASKFCKQLGKMFSNKLWFITTSEDFFLQCTLNKFGVETIFT